MRSTADTGWEYEIECEPTTLYVGESTDGLSVYAAPGWDAWLAAWSLFVDGGANDDEH